MRFAVATACALLICAGCGAARPSSQAKQHLVASVSCSAPLVDATQVRARHVPGTVLPASSAKRAFREAGLRIRPMSVRFFWPGPGAKPEAAFGPAVPTNKAGKGIETVIVAVYPNVFDALTAARGYGRNERGSCGVHRSVGNVLLVWSGREDAHLRSAIDHLRERAATGRR